MRGWGGEGSRRGGGGDTSIERCGMRTFNHTLGKNIACGGNYANVEQETENSTVSESIYPNFRSRDWSSVQQCNLRVMCNRPRQLFGRTVVPLLKEIDEDFVGIIDDEVETECFKQDFFSDKNGILSCFQILNLLS